MTAAVDPRSRRLLIGCYFPRSLALEGVGTFVRGVAKRMREDGWSARLLCPHRTGWEDTGCEVVAYQPGPFGLLRYLSMLRAVSRECDAALLVENNPNMAFTAAFVNAQRPAFSYFYTPWQTLADVKEMGWRLQAGVHLVAKHRLWSHLQSWSRRRCVVATEFQARQLKTRGAAEVHVLRGGGLSSALPIPSREECRHQMGWDDRPVVGYLGHYSPAKGVSVLIDAFTRYNGPAILALAYSGKGRLPRESETQLAALRQAGRVREAGVVDPQRFLAACDVTVLPFVTSSIHHLPLVLLESFAASTPVIVSQVGGVSEAVTPGVHGDVVPPNNPQVLADTLQRHLADLDGCRAMGQRARQLFETDLANEVFCARLSDIFQKERA